MNKREILRGDMNSAIETKKVGVVAESRVSNKFFFTSKSGSLKRFFTNIKGAVSDH